MLEQERFVYRMASRVLTGVVVLLISSVCVSCDRGVPWSLSADNFVWSNRAKDSPDRHANAYYCSDRGQYWGVLRWKGSGQLAGADQLVVLCLNETIDGTERAYQLEHGLALLTWRFARDSSGRGQINRLRVLDRRFFSAQRRCGKTILAYKGPVTGKSNFDDGTGMSWLRFEVKAKKSRHKVVTVAKSLHPLLEKEGNAAPIVECLAPLVD